MIHALLAVFCYLLCLGFSVILVGLFVCSFWVLVICLGFGASWVYCLLFRFVVDGLFGFTAVCLLLCSCFVDFFTFDFSVVC